MTPTIYEIPLGILKAYLEGEGWHLANDNDRWLVYEGQDDINGDPFEVVLPKKTQSSEYPIYVKHTLDILSSIADKSHASVAEDINRADLDEMFIRLDDRAYSTSIPTDIAAEYMAEIDQLVIYAATSEKSKRQHYHRPTSRVRDMVKDIRFGHTVPGSFAFRLEARVFDEQTDRQLRLPGLPPKPMARSVMERIVRGLATAETAVTKNDIQLLIDGYRTGFNSKMCESIAKISSDSGIPVNYKMKWSRMLDITDDLLSITDITIGERHVEYLNRASKQLALTKPVANVTTVVGRVVGFISHDDPHSDSDDGRTVTIYASPRGENDRQIVVELGKEDYLAAMRAHDAWQTISISGVLSKPKSRWELAEPHDFKILW